MAAFGAVAAAAVVALAVWNVQLRSSLESRDQLLASVATAVANDGSAHRVEGSAGSGYVVEREDGSAVAILGSVASLSAGQRYQMWLLSDERLVTAGSFTASDAEVVVVALDRPVDGFAQFAVSIETEVVDTPSSDPVMVAALGD